MTGRKLPYRNVTGYLSFNPVFKKAKAWGKRWCRRFDRRLQKEELLSTEKDLLINKETL